MRKPGGEAGRRMRHAALFAKFHLSFPRAETQPCERIDDRTHAIESEEIIAPGVRLVAIKHAQERLALGALEDSFDFACKLVNALRAPLRQHARMDHQHSVL